MAGDEKAKPKPIASVRERTTSVGILMGDLLV
jgi:hypothetical protein